LDFDSFGGYEGLGEAVEPPEEGDKAALRRLRHRIVGRDVTPEYALARE
jgi:hypothetical protein